MTTLAERATLAATPTTTSPTGPVVVDLYCRMSYGDDGTVFKCEDQEVEGRAAVAANPGWVLGKVHYDHALSAWSPKVIRPSFVDLMERLTTGVAGGVWVRDLGRFSRKPMEGEQLITLAEEGRVIAARYTEWDLTSWRDRKKFREEMADNAAESDRISERSSDGKRAKAARGHTLATRRGFARPGYLPNPKGWRPGEDTRELVPAEQLAQEVAAVRDAVQRLLAGGTLAEVAREWNTQGLLTTNGKRWSGADVRQMLEAPSICGQVEHKGTILAETEGGPLDPATWHRLMLHFASRKRGRPATTYLLSGLMCCGRCGAKLYGRPMAAHKPYPDGQVRRHYWCMPRDKEQAGCGRLAIDQRHADKVVAVMVVERLADPRHADRVARVATKLRQAHQEATAELARLNAEADEVAMKTGQPGWTPSRVGQALANYAPLIAQAQAKLDAVGAVPEVGPATADAQADWDGTEGLDPQRLLAHRRTLVQRAFPEGLVVQPATSRGVGTQSEDRIHPAA